MDFRSFKHDIELAQQYVKEFQPPEPEPLSVQELNHSESSAGVPDPPHAEQDPQLVPGQHYPMSFLAVDLKGHSKISRENAERVVKEVKDLFRESSVGIVESLGGQLFKPWEGDGGVFMFWHEPEQVLESVEAATAILGLEPMINIHRALTDPIKVKVAVHFGHVKWEKARGAVSSPVINLAFHLDKEAIPQAVTITSSALKELQPHVQEHFRPAHTFEGENLHSWNPFSGRKIDQRDEPDILSFLGGPELDWPKIEAGLMSPYKVTRKAARDQLKISSRLQRHKHEKHISDVLLHQLLNESLEDAERATFVQDLSTFYEVSEEQVPDALNDILISYALKPEAKIGSYVSASIGLHLTRPSNENGLSKLVDRLDRLGTVLFEVSGSRCVGLLAGLLNRIQGSPPIGDQTIQAIQRITTRLTDHPSEDVQQQARAMLEDLT